MAKTETVKCPKCNGLGYIGAFSHILNGVCFCCGGQKTIQVNRAKLIAKLPDSTRTKADWVMQSTLKDYAALSYIRLLKIRNFCHGGWDLQDAYPELLNHWQEVGEEAFQVAQSEKLIASH